MNRRLKFCYFVGIVFIGVASTAAPVTTERFSLVDAEAMTIENSPDLKMADSYLELIEQKLKVFGARRLPQIDLEGSYTHIETVPELTTSMGTVTLGDNQNYSVGPVLSYNLFDAGALRKTLSSLKQIEQSKTFEKKYIEVMSRFAARLSYLNVIIADEQYHLSIESFKLSQSQNNDIKKKRKLGASSQLSLSISNRDLLDQKLKTIESKNNLQKAVWDLSLLVAKDPKAPKLFFPMDSQIGEGEYVVYDDLDMILQKLDNKMVDLQQTPFQILALEKTIESTRLEMQVIDTSYWPQLSLRLKTSLDYPNGPRLEQIHQNVIGLRLAMPLYDWGERSGQKGEKQAQLDGLRAQKNKLERDLYLNEQKLKVQLQGLKEQEGLAEQLLIEAIKVADINLDSFRSGKIQYTEVERANVRKFEAQVRRLVLKGQIFSTLSQMAAISQGGLK